MRSNAEGRATVSRASYVTNTRTWRAVPIYPQQSPVLAAWTWHTRTYPRRRRARRRRCCRDRRRPRPRPRRRRRRPRPRHRRRGRRRRRVRSRRRRNNNCRRNGGLWAIDARRQPGNGLRS